MTIKIVLPKSNDKNKIISGHGTLVFNESGEEIKDVMTLDIKIRPDDIVTATINVAMHSETSLDNVHALLGTETLDQIAEMHGYKMTTAIDKGIATVDFKVDCSEIDSVKSMLDILAKYADELPQKMKDELSELMNK